MCVAQTIIKSPIRLVPRLNGLGCVDDAAGPPKGYMPIVGRTTGVDAERIRRPVKCSWQTSMRSLPFFVPWAGVGRRGKRGAGVVRRQNGRVANEVCHHKMSTVVSTQRTLWARYNPSPCSEQCGHKRPISVSPCLYNDTMRDGRRLGKPRCFDQAKT